MHHDAGELIADRRDHDHAGQHANKGTGHIVEHRHRTGAGGEIDDCERRDGHQPDRCYRKHTAVGDALAHTVETWP